MNCFWLTGLPGAGKTTLARLFCTKIKEQGRLPILLDGDQLRKVLQKEKETDYTIEARKALAFNYAHLCKLLVDQNHFVVCSTVSMFHEVQRWNRNNIHGYVEVFVDAPMDVLRKRNQKKLYDKEVPYVPGLNQTVEYPLEPDIHILNDTSKPIEELVDILCKYVIRNL